MFQYFNYHLLISLITRSLNYLNIISVYFAVTCLFAVFLYLKIIIIFLFFTYFMLSFFPLISASMNDFEWAK